MPTLLADYKDDPKIAVNTSASATAKIQLARLSQEFTIRIRVRERPINAAIDSMAHCSIAP